MDKEKMLKELKSKIRQCPNKEKCDRGKILFGRGESSEGADKSKVWDVMFIGWAPNPRYDGRKDRKVFGLYSQTGRMANCLKARIECKMRKSLSVWMTNLIKCSCPEDKRKNAVEHCNRFLKEEIRIIDPKVIVLFGHNVRKNVEWAKSIKCKEIPCVSDAVIIEGKSYPCVFSYSPAAPGRKFVDSLDDTAEMIIQVLRGRE